MDKYIEKIRLEDGRMAERHVTVDENGDKHIELWAEEPRDLKLTERVTEKHAQIISERKVEKIGEDGEIYDVKVESVDPKRNMELVSHIGLAANYKPSKYPTKDELKEAVVAAVSEMQAQTMVAQEVVDAPISAQSIIKSNVEASEGSMTNTEKLWMGAIVVGALLLAYQYFIV